DPLQADRPGHARAAQGQDRADDRGARKEMIRTVALLAMLALACAAFAKEAVPLGDDPKVEARLITIAEELRCLVCQNESLIASRADLAMDLKRQVREQIKAGRSDAEIRDYMVARYGDFVLY